MLPERVLSVWRARMKKRKIEFSSHTGNLALMRNFVREFLNDYRFSEKEQMLMVLGVDEACTNVIRYAYQLRDDQPIALSMEGLRGRNQDTIKPGGLGLHLIRNAFDEVNYVLKPRGTELVLTKNLD